MKGLKTLTVKMNLHPDAQPPKYGIGLLIYDVY